MFKELEIGDILVSEGIAEVRFTVIFNSFFFFNSPYSFRKECEYFHIPANTALELNDLKLEVLYMQLLLLYLVPFKVPGILKIVVWSCKNKVC